MAVTHRTAINYNILHCGTAAKIITDVVSVFHPLLDSWGGAGGGETNIIDDY